MTSGKARIILIIIAAWLTVSPAFAADLTDFPRIVDGDTIVIGSTKIRLDKIDAPETDQICLNASGVRWTCGIDARDQLATHIAGQEIRCSSNGIDAYRRILATCYLADEDLNGWMVQEGWALAYVKYSKAYVSEEEDARTNRRGLWKGAFIAPWDESVSLIVYERSMGG
jgi:endonuclease YncB( thermonuclease family)